MTIAGSYEVYANPANIGVNCPASPFDGVTFKFHDRDLAIYDHSGVGNYLRLASGDSITEPAFTPTDMLLFDQKVDDGAADTGRLYGVNYAGSGCVVDEGVDNSYDLSLTAVGCVLQYWYD